MSRGRQTIAVLKPDQLAAHPGNVRDDLGDLEDMARSIREQGIVQPLTVTEHPTEPDVFRIVDGHRRFNAALMAHETRIPVIVRHELDNRSQKVLMLVTGVHRRELSPLERAKTYGELHDDGMSMSDIAREVGCKPSTVSYYLNLLRLDDETQDKVEAGEVPVQEAVAAVREQRQAERVAADRPLRGRPTGHFSESHPLATKAAGLCSHIAGLYGHVACGPCWEHVIRQDALEVAA